MAEVESNPPPVEVIDEAERGRFVVYKAGDEAELTYRALSGRLILRHVGVPAHLEGQGIGSALVQAAIDRARSRGETVVPACPFAHHWIRTNPDQVEDVSVELGRPAI